MGPTERTEEGERSHGVGRDSIPMKSGVEMDWARLGPESANGRAGGGKTEARDSGDSVFLGRSHDLHRADSSTLRKIVTLSIASTPITRCSVDSSIGRNTSPTLLCSSPGSHVIKRLNHRGCPRGSLRPPSEHSLVYPPLSLGQCRMDRPEENQVAQRRDYLASPSRGGRARF